jgi:hypothetical protein
LKHESASRSAGDGFERVRLHAVLIMLARLTLPLERIAATA